ncbi:MAG: hypothetical protein H6526_04895 [Actinobacteria bacterium]|nr:hypothetical protein [Actinomycetota bacterium]MCB8997258.1 hypothetical protein [Actinomycetota bacterium]MCB9414602.1 hypothetical protein [Actinomycetota bacterium]MCB9423570.1 hypothetical protein [Actinomycetota bacterium]HRY09014.1 hypothetical protein [Candidatus Nanopelagicales bacterium]
MRNKPDAAPSRAAVFAHRGRTDVEAEIVRLLSADALDEGNGEVFDALIESRAAQERAVLSAAARAELVGYQVQADRVSADIAAIDRRLVAARERADALKADLAHARASLRGRP